MREHTQPQTGLVHGFQGHNVLSAGLAPHRLPSPSRTAEGRERVVSPTGRVVGRSSGSSGDSGFAKGGYWRARWIASGAGISVAAILMIVHHIFGK